MTHEEYQSTLREMEHIRHLAMEAETRKDAGQYMSEYAKLAAMVTKYNRSAK